MNAQEARNHLALEKLKRRLRDGSLTESELKARLLRMIKEEESKGPARMDTELMLACEELLWQLHRPLTEAIRPGKREGFLRLREALRKKRPAPARGLVPAGIALAGAAAVMGLFYMTLPRPQPQSLAAAPSVNYTSAISLSESQAPVLQTASLTIPPATVAPTPLATQTPTAAPAPLPTPEPAALPDEEGFTAAPLTQSHGPKYLTLGQLRAQAPASFRYSTGEGETEVPIILPEGEALAVPRLNWKPAEASEQQQSALSAAVSENAALSQTLTNRFVNVSAVPREPDKALPAAGEQEAAELLIKVAQALGIDPGALRVIRQDPDSGLYHPLQGAAADRAVSAEKNDPGYYLLTGVQTFAGAQVFPDDYHYSGPHFGLQASLSGSVTAADRFNISGSLLEQTSAKTDDLPLADISRMLDSLRAMLDDGRLIGIESIELGYELYYESYVSPDDETALNRSPLLALPVWRVMAHGSTETQPITGMIRHFNYDSKTYWCELRFNAQTGEYLDPSNHSVKTYSPVLLTWEQMEGDGDVSLYK